MPVSWTRSTQQKAKESLILDLQASTKSSLAEINSIMETISFYKQRIAKLEALEATNEPLPQPEASEPASEPNLEYEDDCDCPNCVAYRADTVSQPSETVLGTVPAWTVVNSEVIEGLEDGDLVEVESIPEDDRTFGSDFGNAWVKDLTDDLYNELLFIKNKAAKSWEPKSP